MDLFCADLESTQKFFDDCDLYDLKDRIEEFAAFNHFQDDEIKTFGSKVSNKYECCCEYGVMTTYKQLLKKETLNLTGPRIWSVFQKSSLCFGIDFR
jgi:hypothetical protein